jgi:hypothetical protein
MADLRDSPEQVRVVSLLFVSAKLSLGIRPTLGLERRDALLAVAEQRYGVLASDRSAS